MWEENPRELFQRKPPQSSEVGTENPFDIVKKDHHGPVVRLQDLQSTGCGFESYQANRGPVVRLQDLQSTGCGFESYQANR